MDRQLIECVPNISEGRDRAKIDAITAVVETVEGVRLLDVDPGKATNRTVITMVGEPGPVCEAAFRLIKKAQELIDMRNHKGEHPRFGATDVCPLVPISGISMEETAAFARTLAKRVGDELAIPIYCYEAAASEEKRRNLANNRSGEYEGLPKKLKEPAWKPDFGPAEFTESVAKSGATAIGARNFLVAYNVNLNSTSTRRANAIAFDIREAGRVLRDGDPLTGKPLLDTTGEPKKAPGKLKAVKGIGWYIEEYGIAQLSLNLTDITITPVHIAFDEACKSAAERGIRVTGSELVGLIPKQALLDAADFYLARQERSLGISEREKIKIAVKSLGLDDLAPFDPQKKVIEYMLEEPNAERLVRMDLKRFSEETAGEAPAPGGGSVAAYVGALGVALGTMVANLSAHKRGWDERWEEFSQWAVKGEVLRNELLYLVDEDTRSFDRIIAAMGLPKSSEEDKATRKKAILEATKGAINTPLRTMQVCVDSMELMMAMAEKGLKASVSDAGVGALCARTGAIGAYLNVKINCVGLEDEAFRTDVLKKAEALKIEAEQLEGKVMAMTLEKI
ncbi:MAG: glutamate formimidoyltransferase [Flavobacteriales bacterium]|jgi:glutamate formiminotransferase/formiminotetrahydrofolate cyclodeaminase|nr:glutamate formimidoyltransferase [Flavobacteriales bacterium]MBK8708991.1 glutamate formimidoyltransferase [Flavobacteriales bacterium]MCC6939584.1 glutamate formimidoyltransferase [Flavobacteriales bacterium]HQW07156.1 glutamate formimidoyltransferase [Flavobacteriales bacterium]HQW99330.1 glutamate formimidoyltransferase [Flavobacteriales bacterium]